MDKPFWRHLTGYKSDAVSVRNIVENSNTGSKLYPNPAVDYVILRTDNGQNSNQSYQLFDVRGKILDSGIISGNETIIPISKLAKGTYFVKVIDTDGMPGIRKFIKL